VGEGAGAGVGAGTEDDAGTEVGGAVPGPGLVVDVESQPSINVTANVSNISNSLFTPNLRTYNIRTSILTSELQKEILPPGRL
jgi:hypothetical protein